MRLFKNVSAIISAALLLFIITGCKTEPPQTNSYTQFIPMQYNVCSQEYSSDYQGVLASEYRIRFQLPDNHKTVAVTLNAVNSGGFLKDATVAVEQFPYLPETPLWLDLFESGMDFAIAFTEPDPAVYALDGDAWKTLLSVAVSNYQYKTYMIRAVRYDGTVLQQETIPIGKTTIVLSPDVEFLDVKSFLDVPDMQYVEGGGQGFPGKVSYENLHELAEGSSSALPDNIPELRGLGESRFVASINIEYTGGFRYLSSYEEFDQNNPNGNGTIKTMTEYTGVFSDISKISDTMYSMRSSETKPVEHNPSEWSTDEIRYKYTDFTNQDNKKYMLCLPGTPLIDIPEQVKESLRYMTNEELGETLDRYVMYEYTEYEDKIYVVFAYISE